MNQNTIGIIKDKILYQFWDEIEDTDEPCVGYMVTYDTNLLNNGFVFNYLIFEFPDWQEAINSKEFNE